MRMEELVMFLNNALIATGIITIWFHISKKLLNVNDGWTFLFSEAFAVLFLLYISIFHAFKKNSNKINYFKALVVLFLLCRLGIIVSYMMADDLNIPIIAIICCSGVSWLKHKKMLY